MSSSRVSRAGLVALALVLAAGCGAQAASRSARTREHVRTALGELTSEPARRALEAVDAAEASEQAGLSLEADEHASRARAWAAVAVDERSAQELEEQLGALEASTLELEAEAAALEHAAADRRSATVALADSRAARDELTRALARAEADESAPRRARRVGIAEPAEVRRFAGVLEDRARLLLAAAVALGARADSVAAARAALEAIDAEQEPLARLGLADRAHGLARVALADARHHAGAMPEATEIETLREALETEGFTVHRGEQGLGARITEVFDGPGIAASARGRLRRLGELLASHPSGPIVLLVEADADRAAQSLATRRLEALRRAIVGDREREVVVAVLTEIRGPGGEAPPAANAAQVLLSAYVPRAPEPVAPAPTRPPPAEESAAGE